MYFLALAADFDGTLAHDGVVAQQTIDALERLKASGRRLLLVTGRQLKDLTRSFDRLDLFDRVVLENGGVLYDPATQEEAVIAATPSSSFVEALMKRGVDSISVGHVVVATWTPHEGKVLEAIEELGLELQIVFNKGAVMVLPTGVSKATGLLAALDELDLSARNVVAIGDAENDHGFLRACGCGAAVANAIPSVKSEADICLEGAAGEGVAELIERIIAQDASLVPLARRGLLLGHDANGSPFYAPPEKALLIVGNSGSGKSTFATWLTEMMMREGLEFCIFDPEGDYLGLEGAVSVGTQTTPPLADRALELLLKAGVNLVVTTLAVPEDERKPLFEHLFSVVAELRARSGRPHWILIDEAHQYLTKERSKLAGGQLAGSILITLGVDLLSESTLDAVGAVIAFGGSAGSKLRRLALRRGLPEPIGLKRPKTNECLAWSVEPGQKPWVLRIEQPQQDHNRHAGKYASGDVGTWNSFYFRGPELDINDMARNLTEFGRIARAVADPVWEHHLRSGHYSAWFRDVIRDDVLADEAAAVEADFALSPAQSRDRVLASIARRYSVGSPEAIE